MKIKYHLMPILWALVIIFLFGCTSTVTNLQEVDVTAMPNRTAIKITENRKEQSLEIRANASLNNSKLYETKGEGHTNVNQNGIFEVDPVQNENYFLETKGVNNFDFDGYNIRWAVPRWQANIELDFKVDSNFVLNGGIHYSELNGKSFWGENLGIAFVDESDMYGYRFDLFGRYNQVSLDALAVVSEREFSNGTRKVYFSQKQFDEDYFNLGMIFTLNTKNRDWFLNYFFSYSLAWQTLYDIDKNRFGLESNETTNFSYMESYHTVSAGIYKTLFDGGRLIAGARLMKYSDSKNNFTMPDFFIQYDFIVF